jgi:hypothetical protein
MARCAYCKAKEAELYEDGSPICLKCAELTGNNGGIQTALVQALSEAMLRADSANAEFTAIMSDIPGGLPESDGVTRIRNASAQLVVARHRLMEAHTRLADYLDRGIMPEGLERSGQ